MVKMIFSLDYEIHGNGDGNPIRLMVDPTERMLDVFDKYGAKLAIMADVAEILKFKEYYEKTDVDLFGYSAISRQLIDAIKRGHDVQLHLHSSYFNAEYRENKWQQYWKEYDFASLPIDRMDYMVSTGKEFLEKLLQPINPEYKCIAFRAANWSVSPSENIVKTLANNGILIDTSIFKYGKREGIVSFDYSHAWSEMRPWRASLKDICRQDKDGCVYEFPIYSKLKPLMAFLTVERIMRVLDARKHSIAKEFPQLYIHKKVENRRNALNVKRLFQNKYPWKADFNQCTGKQLINELAIVNKLNAAEKVPLPFVLIGHSKLFTKLNEIELNKLLEYGKANPGRVGFSTFGEYDENSLKAIC